MGGVYHITSVTGHILVVDLMLYILKILSQYFVSPVRARNDLHNLLKPRRAAVSQSCIRWDSVQIGDSLSSA